MVKKKIIASASHNVSMNRCGCKFSWTHAILGLITAVGGLLFIWPQGWFTFEHTLGVLVFLLGLKMIWWAGKCNC